MENEKVTPKDRPKSRQRKKLQTPKQFLDEITDKLLNFSPGDQNAIVKELIFAVQEKRKMLIEQSRENTDMLNTLMEELTKL